MVVHRLLEMEEPPLGLVCCVEGCQLCKRFHHPPVHVLEDELAQHEHAPGVRPRGDLVQRRDVRNAVEIGDDRRVVRVCVQPND